MSGRSLEVPRPEGDDSRSLADFVWARNAEMMENAERVHRGDCASLRDQSPAPQCDCGYPEQIVAECNARWRVVSLAQTLERWYDSYPAAIDNPAREHLAALYEVLGVLATAYANHQDYRPDLW